MKKRGGGGGGGQSPVYICISTCTLGGSDFRLSETASGAFSGTL